MIRGGKVVAISGASSFTGYWISRAFADSGWQVHSIYAGMPSSYSGVRRKRVDGLSRCVMQHFDIRAEDGSMADWIRSYKPSIWVHHHHLTSGLWNDSYDLKKSLSLGLEPLPQLVSALSKSDCRGIIYSGSYFETRGLQVETNESMSLYVDSKRKVRRRLEELCEEQGLLFSHLVVPNPVGPLEDSTRLIPSLIASTRSGTDFNLRFPHAVIDQYPVVCLSEDYVRLANELLSGQVSTIEPSGWVGYVHDWVRKVCHELICHRLSLPYPRLSYDECKPLNDFSLFDFKGRTDLDWDVVWDAISLSERKKGLG